MLSSIEKCCITKSVYLDWKSGDFCREGSFFWSLRKYGEVAGVL